MSSASKAENWRNAMRQGVMASCALDGFVCSKFASDRNGGNGLD